jgi:hypothetical protein
MRSDKEFDSLLKSALTQNKEPDADTRQKVLAQWKENQNMDKKKWSVAVAAAACVLMTTVSVGATTLILNSKNTVESTEIAESQTKESYEDEYTTYIQSGAWKDDIADAELVSTSEKLEKNSSGAYECTYSEEADGASYETKYYIYDSQFVDNLAVEKYEVKYNSSEDSVNLIVRDEKDVEYEPSEDSTMIILVAEKTEDGTAKVKIYKK